MSGRGYLRIISGALLLGCALALSSCSTGKSVSKSSQDNADRNFYSERVSEAHVSALRKQIVDEALTWMDTPYKYAAAEKGEGTDCSGLVLRVYESVADKKLPRNSAKQAEFCKSLKAKDVKAGDLVFFATGKDPEKVSHVGIMIDEDSFIHASSRKGVVVNKVSSPYYTRTFIMYGAVPGIK